MARVTVERTLMKSPPELWTLLQDPASVAAWLQAIPCNGLSYSAAVYEREAEQRIAWRHVGLDGTRAATAVALERKGWGTHVTITGDLETGGGLDQTLRDRIQAALERTLEQLGTDRKQPTALVSA